MMCDVNAWLYEFYSCMDVWCVVYNFVWLSFESYKIETSN